MNRIGLHNAILMITLAGAVLSGCTPAPLYRDTRVPTQNSPSIPQPQPSDLNLPDNENTFTGIASYYGPKFVGRPTANGEIFDPRQMTAAHRTLPFDTMLRVTLISTGRSVVVRINDRGPYAKNRVLDLSEGAAERLGLKEMGVGFIHAEILTSDGE